MTRGNQTVYTQEVADAICDRLADGESLNFICKTEGFPPESTVRGWVVDNREGFAAKYTRSRDIGLDVIAEEVLAIADDSSNDRTIRRDEKGKEYEVVDHDHINRSRLRFDARRWYLSKLAPKRYGESQTLKHADADGNSMKAQIIITQGLEE